MVLIAAAVGAFVLVEEDAPFQETDATVMTAQHTPTTDAVDPSALAATVAPTMATTLAPTMATTQSGAGSQLGLDQQIKDATVRAGKILREGSTIMADGKFSIPGAGTKESPYEITWELLMSAGDTYIPRLGEREIPQRVALLNGAFVRISGYIAFPLIATESQECLVMLNQWDGCCIGIPPSPYDAIEVRLLSPADSSSRHVVRIGTIEGVFHIDPYVMEKWLIGLFTMDQAVLSTEL